MQVHEITLAGQPYKVTAPLTLDQLIELQVAVVLPDTGDPQEDHRRGMRRAKETIVTALRVDNPDLTMESLGKMRITPDELVAASGKILEISGLVARKGDAPGEANAEAG